MERYTVVDNKIGCKTNYSQFYWNFAWSFVFICGMITGACMVYFFN